MGRESGWYGFYEKRIGKMLFLKRSNRYEKFKIA